MENKIQFAYDYIYLARDFQFASKQKGPDWIADAAAKLFLIQWGLSPDEVDEANAKWLDDANKSKLPEFMNVFERFVGHIENDPSAVERFVIQFSALSYIDFDFSPDEGRVLTAYRDRFDYKPSEFERLWNLGADLAIALDYFGREFIKFRGESEN